MVVGEEEEGLPGVDERPSALDPALDGFPDREGGDGWGVIGGRVPVRQEQAEVAAVATAEEGQEQQQEQEQEQAPDDDNDDEGSVYIEAWLSPGSTPPPIDQEPYPLEPWYLHEAVAEFEFWQSYFVYSDEESVDESADSEEDDSNEDEGYISMSGSGFATVSEDGYIEAPPGDEEYEADDEEEPYDEFAVYQHYFLSGRVLRGG